MAHPERTSGENGISLKTWIIILLLTISGALGYDRLFNNSSAEDTGTTDRSSVTSDSNTDDDETRQEIAGDLNTAEGTALSILLQSLGIDSIDDAVLPTNRDETPALAGLTGEQVRITDAESYIHRQDIFDQLLNTTSLEDLFAFHPSARNYLAPVVFGPFIGWENELPAEDTISQNFSDILNTDEGRQAVLEANQLFQSHLTTRIVNGRETTVFTENPTSVDYTGLWIASPEGGDGHVRSTLTATGFTEAQMGSYLQYMGYVQLYAQAHNVPWTEQQVGYITSRLFATSISQFEVQSGYTPFGAINANGRVITIDYGINQSFGTRRLQADPDYVPPTFGDPEDRILVWNCVDVTNEGNTPAVQFPIELDGENAVFGDAKVATDVNTLPRVTNPEDFIALIVNGQGFNDRYWHHADNYAMLSIPTDFENSDEQPNDAQDYVIAGRCYVAPPVEVTPVPVIITEQPNQPNPPQETPPPTNTTEPEKSSPGNQTNTDGEENDDPTGGEEIIDGMIDTDGDGEGDEPDNIGPDR